jgi:hypothetical protein
LFEAARRPVVLYAAFWLVFAGALRVAVVPPESCGDERVESIETAAVQAKDWLVRNQEPDGRYLYEYDAESDRVIPAYSEVRHAGVTMSLYQAAGRLGDTEALSAADIGLEWMRDHLVRRSDWAALTGENGREAKLGSSALMLAALAERRLATGDAQYDELMHDLGRFIVMMQREDGGFYVSWLEATEAPRYEGTSRYYPGEAFWSLALLRRALPDDRWDAAVLLGADFLIERRDEVEDVPFPPLPDQWTAYGLAEITDLGLTSEQAEYARDLAGRFGLLVRTEAQRQDGWLGRLVRGPESRAAGTGTWVEGLASLWRLASADERLSDLRPKIVKRLRCSSGILAERQVSADESAEYDAPERTRGAWFRDGRTRMDDQQHALSGLIYALDAIEGRTAREPDAFLASR